MIRKSLCVSSAVFLVFQLANVSAQESSEKEIPPKVPETSLSVTSHAIQLNGEPLKYTATAGYLLINEDTEKPKANIFFTAYTKDGAEDESRRPITFGDVPAAVEFGRVAAAPVNTLRQQPHRCQEISVCF